MIARALQPWTWIHRLPGAVVAELRFFVKRFILALPMLWAVVKVDFKRRYAGSALGVIWYPLYSAMLLGMYCFVYMVIFSQRNREFSNFHFVLFIFSGLIPFLAFSDAVASSVSSIKSNIALVKNTIFPVELIPVKHLLVSLMGSGITVGVLLVLVVIGGEAGWHLLYLPVPVFCLFFFALGVIWVLSAIAVLVPDLAYVVNILLMTLMFVSPIGFSLEQVPESARILVYLNPLTYLVESFRYTFIGERFTPMWADLVFGGASFVAVCLAATFFRRIMPLFSDHE